MSKRGSGKFNLGVLYRRGIQYAVLSLLLSGLSAEIVLYACAENKSHSRAEDQQTDSAEKKSTAAPLSKKNVPFRGYGKFFSNIKKFCEAMAEDGRADFFSSTAKEFSDRDVACDACRPLFQAFAQNCAAKKFEVRVKGKSLRAVSSSEDGEEKKSTAAPVPTPFLLQREPSALCLDRGVRLFSDISEDEILAQKTKVALQKLFFILDDKSRGTTATREYFSTLSGFILPLFSQANAYKENHTSTSEVKASHEQLGSLFDEYKEVGPALVLTPHAVTSIWDGLLASGCVTTFLLGKIRKVRRIFPSCAEG